MVALSTPSYNPDFIAPDFTLLGIDNTQYNLYQNIQNRPFCVVFICNHCPKVKEIINRLAETCTSLEKQGIHIVAVMPNDADTYTEDSYENMKKFALHHQLKAPYVYDADQTTARAYHAVCTPDFFGFNKEKKLRYRGGFHDNPETGISALETAMLEIKKTGQAPESQKPSIGCSIKWKS